MVERLTPSGKWQSGRHEVGEQLGSYRLTDILHRDGYSEIYRAVDVRDDSTCIVKCFGADMAEQDEDFANQIMMHEQELLGAQDLDLIKAVVADGDWRNTFVVCQDKEGRSLADRLATEGTVNEMRCLLLMRGIIASLQPFENAGFGHGSLTPQAIKIGPDGKVVLVSESFAGMTGAYACQDAQDGDFSLKSDFFSLGAIMYYMLTGEAPFGEAGRMIPLWHRNLDLSADTMLFVHRLMHMRAEVRPNNIAECLQALSKIDKDRHLSTYELEKSLVAMGRSVKGTGKKKKVLYRRGRAGERSRPRSGIVGKILVLLVLLAVGAFGYMYYVKDERLMGWLEKVGMIAQGNRPVVEEHPVEGVAGEPSAEGVQEAEKEAVAMQAGNVDKVEEEAVEDVAAAEKEEKTEASQEEETTVTVEEAEPVAVIDGAEGVPTDGGVDVVAVVADGEAVVAAGANDKDGDDVAADKAEDGKLDAADEAEEQERLERQKQFRQALRKRNWELVEKLLTENDDIKLDFLMEDGVSPLQYYCVKRNAEAVEYLLKKGADPDWKPDEENVNFQRPLKVALNGGRESAKILRLLLKFGADPDLLNWVADDADDKMGIISLCTQRFLKDEPKLQYEMWNAWLDGNRKFISRSEVAAKLLLQALEGNLSKSCVKELIRRKKNLSDDEYGAALIAAMKVNNRNEILELMKQGHVNVNGVCEFKENGVARRETPLFHAVRTGMGLPAVRWLLENGASVKWKNEDGEDVLDLNTEPQIKELLLQVKGGKKLESGKWRDKCYTTATTRIFPNSSWEIDLNAPTVSDGHSNWQIDKINSKQKVDDKDIDFEYQAEEGVRRLIPKNGCEAWVMTGNLTPFEQLKVAYIVKQKFSADTITDTKEDDTLDKGAVILFRTSRGNYGKMRVVRYEEAKIGNKKTRGVTLIAHWTVYHLDEAEVRESHSKKTW